MANIVSSNNLTSLYGSGQTTIITSTPVPNVAGTIPSKNLTTLYSGSGNPVQAVLPYGNSNVVSLLNAGTDGANTVTNIVATGTVTASNVNTPTVYSQGMQVQGYDYVQMQYSNSVALPVSPYDIGVGSWFYLDAGGAVWQSNTTGTLKTVVLGNDGSINANGNITANYYFGNGSQLTGIISTGGNSNYANYAGNLINGTSNIAIPVANGQINLTVNGVSVGNFTQSNTTLTFPLINTKQNIVIGNVAGNTSLTTDLGLIAIGSNGVGAGQQDNLTGSIAIGTSAGNTFQDGQAIAIGESAGLSQLNGAVAIGASSGNNQASVAVAIGQGAGPGNQGTGAVAIGYNAGGIDQGQYGVAIGAQNFTGNYSIAIGQSADATFDNSIVLGANGTAVTAPGANTFTVLPIRNANTLYGLYYEPIGGEITWDTAGGGGGGGSAIVNGLTSVNIPVANGNVEFTINGSFNGQFSEFNTTLQFPLYTGNTNNQIIIGPEGNVGNISLANTNYTVAIGSANTGLGQIGNNMIAIGTAAGSVAQNDGGIAIGNSAGQTQGINGIAIGNSAGQTQGINSIAFGNSAGQIQGTNSIAIGNSAGANTQSDSAIAIGHEAGLNGQGLNSIAIGEYAGQTAQGNNTIILNATGAALDFTTANSFVVKPVRNANTANVMFYDDVTGEITYDVPIGGDANYANFAGNLINGTSNVNIVTANGNVTVGVNGNANIATFTDTSVIIGNLVLLSSNVILGANAGDISTGNYAIAIGEGAGQLGGANSMAIGINAGRNQNAGSIAIGNDAGAGSQGVDAIALGTGAGGNVNQGANSIAIGASTGNNQSIQAIAIGLLAGATDQGYQSIAIGANAGVTSQANNSIILNATGSALDQTTANTFTVKPVRLSNTSNVMFYDTTSGEITYDLASNIIVDNANYANYAGNLINGTSNVNIPSANGNITFSVGGNANVVIIDSTTLIAGNLSVTSGNVTIGYLAGSTGQGSGAIAIGNSAGITNQGANSIAIGRVAGNNQGISSVVIGYSAGANNTGNNSVAIGASAGGEGVESVAVGSTAGSSVQGPQAVAIGTSAGQQSQSLRATAVGYQAGLNTQGISATAIGDSAGYTFQNGGATAVGANAGYANQGFNSVAIGISAGQNYQGSNSIAIGAYAGNGAYLNGQANNSIIINATGSALNQTTANTFNVKPVRNANTSNVMFYDNTTGEITYDLIGNTTVANANYAAYAGNVTINAQPNITSVGNLIYLNVRDDSNTSSVIRQFTPNSLTINTNFTTTTSYDTTTTFWPNNNTNFVAKYVIRSRGNSTTPTTAVNGDRINQDRFLVFNGNTNVLAGAETWTLVAGGTLDSNANQAFAGGQWNIFTGNPAGGNLANNNALATQNQLIFTNSGQLQIVPSTPANTSLGQVESAINITNYGTNVANLIQVGGITQQRARGNRDSVTGLQPGDQIGRNIYIAHNNTAYQTANVSQYRVVVDSSYVLGQTIVPQNHEIQVVANVANVATFRTTSFYSNGLASFPGNITTSSNVSASYFIGNGSSLTDITGANVTGQVGNALVAGTVYTNAQPNITSVGTLTTLTVSGNANVGNIGANNAIFTTGNITSASIGNLVLTKYNETVIAGGNTGAATLTPNVAAGTIYNYTLTGNITISALGNAVAGSGATLILTQDATGNRLLTSTMKFLGGTKTLSTAANAIDIMSVFYDGTTYYASLGKGFA